MNIDDARLLFYGTFLRHSVASAVEAIDEASQERLGRPLTHKGFEDVRTVLLEGLAALPNSVLHETRDLDRRMATEIRAIAGDRDPDGTSFDAAIVSIVHKLIGDFAESLVGCEVGR